MNPFDFVRAGHGGGSFLPFLIFIAWIVISVVSGNQAKKKKQMQQVELRRRSIQQQEQAAEEPVFERHETVPEAPSVSNKETERKSGDFLGALRRELENALEEQRSRETSSAVEHNGPLFEPVKEEHVTRRKDTAGPVAAVRPATVPVYDVSRTIGPVIGEHQREEQSPADVAFSSLDEVRKGFVWSEVLAPPVALRE